jgi:outer membrane protein insertion porin family
MSPLVLTGFLLTLSLGWFVSSHAADPQTLPPLKVDQAIEAGQPKDPQEEGLDPTPIQEFAPESLRNASQNKRYDQGVTVSRIEVDGNQLIQDGPILENMVLRPGSLYDVKALRDDLKRIYDMGYFTEKIKATPVATASGILLKVQVEENIPVRGVSVKGNTKLSEEEIQSAFQSQTGLPQNLVQLQAGIQKVQQMYADKGYVLARVANIQDDPDGMINLDIKEGQLEKISFVGNRKTKDFVMERAMATKQGETYNEKVLSEDLKRLFATQAFDDVRRVITVSPTDPDKYNLVVEVDEKRSGAISLGGGFDTGTGLFGTLGYSDPNFMGRGESFNSVFAVGSGVIGRDESQANARTYQFDVGWSTPSIKGTNNALAVNAFGRDFASFNVPLGIERRVGGEVTWAKPLNKIAGLDLGNHWTTSLSLRGENVNMREGASDATLASFNLTPQQRERQLNGGTFLTLTPTLAYDTRDNRFNPESGWYNTYSLGGAMALTGGLDSYSTANVNLRRYIKISEGMTLALNGQLGSSLLGDIPEFNAFRLGGIYSVRGWQEGGLGTGNGFALGTAELRTKVPFLARYEEKVPFLNSVRLAFFADAGTVIDGYDTNQSFDRDEYGLSAGIGLRVNLPGLGPIRLDYALPLSGGNSEYYRRFNFGIGQKF